jgi:hypothetical protein
MILEVLLGIQALDPQDDRDRRHLKMTFQGCCHKRCRLGIRIVSLSHLLHADA